MATDADAQAYIDEVELQTGETYPAKYDSAIDQLVQDLKTAGVFTGFDVLYVHANHSALAGKINLFDPDTFQATDIGSPRFTQDQGFDRNAGTNGLNTNFVPSTDGVQYTLNNASYGVYLFGTDSGTEGDDGVYSGSLDGATNYIFSRTVRVNGGGTNFPSSIIGSRYKTVAADRSDSSTTRQVVAGSITHSGARTSESLPTVSQYILGRNNSGSIDVQTDETLSFSWYGRSFTEAEHADIHTAFEDYFTAIESTATVLTAEQGSYSITGQVANLLYNRVLTADQGTFTLTGQDAILSLIYSLTAEQGSYTITGATAELLENFILNAEQGSYTITGQDVTLLKNYVLLAQQGSYAVNGQDANFLRSLILAADQGSYTVTGFDTAIFKGLRITLESGNYAITGNEVDLLRKLVLQAQSGSYTLTGQQADLIRNLILSAEQGTYTVTGQDVELITQNSPEILTLLSTISTTLDLDSKI